MYQILQNLNDGSIELQDVPSPAVTNGKLLIKTNLSLISSGSERILLEFGKSNLIGKIKSQPDKVRQVLDKMRTDGIMTTIEAVKFKLDQPIPLGYSNVGSVLTMGNASTVFKPGDRVVSNGSHAEIVNVPYNLCAKIPDNVTDEGAVFTVLGAIAMQGVRLANPTIGEKIVVTGLGVVGLLTVQILVANGCSVLALDFDDRKVGIAREFGAEAVNISGESDPVKIAETFSNDRGVDAVLITAATTSNEPVHQAAQMCRKRGRIILVGVAGLELSRADFYEKEITFQVSCSYGPGRYDEKYEQKGEDYPYGFVRWTAQRNFEAVLDLMSRGKIDVKPLISKVIPFENAGEAYGLLLNDKSQLGIVLRYREKVDTKTIVHNPDVFRSKKQEHVIVGMIGAGNFTYTVLLPALKNTQARLKSIGSANGTNGTIAGKKFGFEQFTSDTKSIIEDEEINTVFIATRHDSHARLVLDALRAGKHVFVEKPLALNREELSEIKQNLVNAEGCQLMVGFNRRFSPYAVKIRELIGKRSEPISVVYTVNAGFIPMNHWVYDPELGGGRIIGEVCHFIDLIHFIVDKPIVSLHAAAASAEDTSFSLIDTVTITIQFADSSIGTVHYFSNGSKKYEKEKMTIFCQGTILELNNFKQLKGYGFKRFRSMKSWRQEKGQRQEVEAFIKQISEGGELLIPWSSLEQVTLATFDVVEQIKKRN